ncbi:cation diffusion facilitator CzcD-associated flavoprotein CzcO [Bradyrhizobium diazoefficiens]
MKPDIQFGKRVVEVIFDDNSELWTVRTDKGDSATTRFVITAVGALSTANMPPFKGLGSFKGKCYHTSQWPHDGVDFTAKRVGVIGTGATAVQAIPEIAQQAKHLTVFQRTPAFCVPARNAPRRPRGHQGAQGRLRWDPPAHQRFVLWVRTQLPAKGGPRYHSRGA